jgi:SAM-dependent methyltransferase
MNYPVKKLTEVFRDTGGHKESANIIFARSANKEDIREFALKNLDLKNALQVIDLGCGFGFFTEVLKHRIADKTDVTGIDCFDVYREPYLKLCRDCSFNGHFSDKGTQALTGFNSDSFDLILSSFSLYFFPGMLPQIARTLKATGTCIIITHAATHLMELTQLVNNMLKSFGYPARGPLPHDKLISNFPAETGIHRLSQYFDKIEKRDYLNELIFTKEMIADFLTYFRYKISFFIPGRLLNDLALIERIETGMIKRIQQGKEFRMTKNDAVFICTHPVKEKN